MSAPRAVLVTVGDELLLGRTVDTNAAWLGRELAALGVPVVKRYTVGDEDGAIREAVSHALTKAEAEVILLTGGLGPTRDDRTREAVAELLEAPLRLDAALLAALEARFRARGYARLPELNFSQAQVPDGALVLANPQGTAPGLALEREGRLVVLLPGVPRELKAIFQGDLQKLLRARFGARLAPICHRTLHTTGLPESELAARVEARLPADLGPVRLAFLPDLTGVDIRLTALDVASPEEAERWLGRIEEALAPALNGFRFEAESGDVVEALSRVLVASRRRLAVAESCSGGLVAKRITDRPGASAYFLGGIVAYADDVKTRVLGVSPAALAAFGAVSEEVALQMARGVARAFDAEAGLSVTGVAGPEGGTEAKPVGTVWYAVSLDGEAVSRREVFPGDRSSVRERAAQAVLALLLRRLEGTS